MGLFFIPLVCSSLLEHPAVNLTDGLDGLATVPVMLVALSFTLISYVVGNTIFSEYLQIQYTPLQQIIVKHEIVLAIIEAFETVSVIIQVVSFKLTAKEF